MSSRESSTASQDEANLRVLTYNIHKGIGGLDRRYRLERIAKVISGQSPDIVLLQEVDDGVPRSNRQFQAELLAERLEMKHWAYQRNVQLTRGYYGNAILSRMPIVDEEDIDLTIPLKKRRGCLVAHCRMAIDSHQRTLLIANLHLGLAGFERKMQLNRILQCETLQHTRKSTPAIIGGDFNDVWSSLGRKIMKPAGFLPVSRDIKTFPAAMPVRPLDNLFYRGDLELDHAFACRSRVAKTASDHLPLVAEFRVRSH